MLVSKTATALLPQWELFQYHNRENTLFIYLFIYEFINFISAFSNVNDTEIDVSGSY